MKPRTIYRMLAVVLCALGAPVSLAIDYYVRGPVGTVAHPVTGEATVCGADVTTLQGDDATLDPTDPATPWLTLDQSFAATFLTAGDTVFVSGRVRMGGDFNDWCLGLDGIDGAINVKQWPGQPAAIIRGFKMPGGFEDGVTNSGGAALTQNKTVGAGYWTATGNAYTITCDGTGGKADLTESGLCTGIATVVYDYDLAGNIDSVGRRKSHLKGPVSSGVGVKVRGAWSSVANGGAATAYTVGDSVKDGGVTYICITAHTSSGATLLTTDSAKWESFATQKTAIGAAATGAFGVFTFDFQTGELVVRLPTGATPANASANGVEYALCSKTGLYYSSAGGTFTHTGAVISGIRFQGWGDEKAIAPYGTAINMSFTQDCVIESCTFEDNGDHAAAGGTKVNNLTIRNCTVIGGQAGCYFIVFNASGGTPAWSATGLFSNSTVYLNTWLGHNALTVGNSIGSPGVYVHGPHSGVVVDGVTFVHYIPASGTRDPMAPVNSDNATAPSDPTRARNYPLYLKNCSETNGVGWATGGVTSYIGFENCSWRGDAVYLVSTSERYMVLNGTGTWCFEGCEIAADIRNGNGNANTALFHINATSTVRLTNCSLFDFAPSHSAAHNQGIFFYAAQPNGTTGLGVFCSGSVMGFANADRAMRVCIGDNPDFTGAVWTAGTKTLTKAGAFGFAAIGDTFTASGTGVAGGTATIATVAADGGSCTLTSVDQIDPGNLGAVVAGTYLTCTAKRRTFTDNVYYNCGYTAAVASDTWSAAAPIDSAAEWLATVDTGAINNQTTSPYVLATGVNLEPTAAAKVRYKLVTPHVTRGINGRLYDGRYGAWQYQGGGAGPGAPGTGGVIQDRHAGRVGHLRGERRRRKGGKGVGVGGGRPAPSRLGNRTRRGEFRFHGTTDRATWPVDPDAHLGLMYIALKRFCSDKPEGTHRAMVGEAYEVLCNAARTFRPELGLRFSTHAVNALRLQLPRRLAMMEGCRRNGHTGRMTPPPRQLSALVWGVDKVEWTPAARAEAPGIDPVAWPRVVAALEMLTERQRTVVTARAGGRSFVSIAREMDVTTVTVRNVHAQALAKMRRVMGVERAGETMAAA